MKSAWRNMNGKRGMFSDTGRCARILSELSRDEYRAGILRLSASTDSGHVSLGCLVMFPPHALAEYVRAARSAGVVIEEAPWGT